MNITVENRSLAMLMTVSGIEIMYFSILLSIKLKNFQDSEKIYYIFSEKIYELTTVYYELLY